MGVTAMLRKGTFGVLAAMALFAAGCGAGLKSVSLKVNGNVPDASVTIDDQYIGSLAYVMRRGVAMPPGKHRVTIEKVGFFPWDQLVDAPEAGQPVVLDVQLVPIPD
jgi:hypothetical protein